MKRLLAMALLSATAYPATYWVSPTGAASWASCQGASPLAGTSACSIATANSNAAAGDVVNLRGGTYSQNIFIDPVNSGTSSSKITFQAYSGETVNVTNQHIANSDHEGAAWAAWNGATVTHSTEQAKTGTYSTKIVASGSGQGARSDATNLVKQGFGFMAVVWVRSSASSINLSVIRVSDSSVVFTDDITITPNEWEQITGYAVIASTGDHYVVVRSNATAPTGTTYVDRSRLFYYQRSIMLDSNDYIVIRGVNVGPALGGFEFMDGATHNEIDASSFTDFYIYSNSLIWNNTGSPSTHNWIHNSTFHDSGHISVGVGTCDDGQTLLRLGGDAGTDASDFNLIEDNVFYHGGHDLAIISSRYNIIRRNVMHNEGWLLRQATCSNNPTLFGNRGLLFENPGGDGGFNLVEDNRIGHLGTPPDDDGASAIENPTDNNIFRYNFLYKAGATGLYFKSQSGLPDNNRVYNNTIYANGGGEDINIIFQAGITFVCFPTDPVNNVIKNNIVYANVDAVHGEGCLGYEYTNNLETDPSFVNPNVDDPTSLTLPNLSLQSGSSAIDGGTNLTLANGSGSNSTTLVVDDSLYFQDGTYGSDLVQGVSIFPDWIAIGTVGNTVQISSINYATHTITLASAKTWSDNAPIWLYKKSDGAVVLAGSAPDYGASEYIPAPYSHRSTGGTHAGGRQ